MDRGKNAIDRAQPGAARGRATAFRGRWHGALVGAALLAAASLGYASAGPADAAPGAAAGADQPQPTATPVSIQGYLQPNRPGCGSGNGATLRECGSNDLVWVRAGSTDLSRFMWRDVQIEGVVGRCGLDRYIDLNTIEQIAGCGNQPSDPRKVNLALGRTIVPSTEQPGFAARHVTDGDPLTYWYTPSDDGWLYVDLGQAVTFNEVRLLWGAPQAQQYGIYVWDGERWSLAFQKREAVGGDETVTFARTYARYVLVHLIRSEDPRGGIALREWQIFGVATPNLALGAQVDASSTASAEEAPGKAVDGDERTGWASTSVDPRIWVRVWFPRPTRLSEFRLLWDAAGMADAYWAGFYRGNTVTAWSDRLASRNPRQQLSWPRPIEADAFIVLVDGARAGRVKLLELELYGPEAENRAGLLEGARIELGLPGPALEPFAGAILDGLAWEQVGLSPADVPALPAAPSIEVPGLR